MALTKSPAILPSPFAGLSRFFVDGDAMTGATGSWRWMAPEVAQNKKYDEKVDIYSWAMCVCQMISCELPFSVKTELESAILATQGYRPHRPSRAKDDVWQLVCECWAQDPSKRPSAEQLLRKLEAIAISRGLQNVGPGLGQNAALERQYIFSSPMSTHRPLASLSLSLFL